MRGACDSLLTRSFQTCALAMLKERRPAMALGYALAAIQTAPGVLLPKALYRAGMACADLHMPQAAMHFLTQVRCDHVTLLSVQCVAHEQRNLAVRLNRAYHPSIAFAVIRYV